MTPQILQIIRERDCAKVNGKEILYKEKRNLVTKLIRESKTQYFTDAVNQYKNNPAKISKLFNEIAPQKPISDTPSVIKINDNEYTTDKEIADVLNKHFTSIGV